MTVAIEPFAEHLTQAEEVKVKELAAAVAHHVQASAAHSMFCTRGTYVRYLRARGWNVHKAARMLEDTLKWRESYKPEELTFDSLSAEAARGKVFILEKPDKEGRPVVFMRPRKEVYGGSNEDRLKWVVYIMEHASKLADAQSPDGKMAWLLDFVGYNRKNQPPWRVSLSTLQIVQNHYPERLGKAVNFKPPFLFEIFWKAIRPFVDPVTRDKLVFLHGGEEAAEISKYFDMDQLDDTLGGPLPEDGMWDFESYGERMRSMDAALKQQLEVVTAALAPGSSP